MQKILLGRQLNIALKQKTLYDTHKCLDYTT